MKMSGIWTHIKPVTSSRVMMFQQVVGYILSVWMVVHVAWPRKRKQGDSKEKLLTEGYGVSSQLKLVGGFNMLVDSSSNLFWPGIPCHASPSPRFYLAWRSKSHMHSSRGLTCFNYCLFSLVIIGGETTNQRSMPIDQKQSILQRWVDQDIQRGPNSLETLGDGSNKENQLVIGK